MEKFDQMKANITKFAAGETTLPVVKKSVNNKIIAGVIGAAAAAGAVAITATVWNKKHSA